MQNSKNPMEKFTMAPSPDFFLSPIVKYDPSVMFYGHVGNMLMPMDYTNWQEETMSWKKSCYIHTGLSMRGTWCKMKGPEAEKLLSENTVSDFSTMKVGRARHVIFTNQYGSVMGHGVVLRLAEDEFIGYGCDQNIMYLCDCGKYDVEPCRPEYRYFVYQIGGPRSLETLEHACQEDLHDLKFLNFQYVTIAGQKVRILRLGMAGTLAYEVHGEIPQAQDVYGAILEAGQPYEIKRLGEFYASYCCQHTENGFPQAWLHFYNAFREDEDFYRWYREKMIPEIPGVEDPFDAGNGIELMHGTLGDNIKDYYRNPIELGWGHQINWNHDFIGKEALRKIADQNPRKAVTLIWNPEDILDVHASYLQNEKDPYMFMEYPKAQQYANYQYRVEDKNGRVVGVTSFRTYTLYQRKHISLCCLDADEAEIGNEVIIIWGDRDKYPIKKIRGTVAPFPSLDLQRNDKYDIESIPRFVKEN